jgi:hypothetical protein
MAYSQVTISGPACVAAGVQYEYIISGGNWDNSTYMSWCLTGGVIAGTTNSCKSGTPVVYVYVIWNSGITSGTVSLSTSIGDAPNLQVNIVPALQGGTISSSTQSINYNTVPSTIDCSVASGGSCSPTYSYQWQFSVDGTNYSNITNATSQNLAFSSALTQTTYYRRMVTETSSGTVGYSNVATVIVYPPLVGGTLSPSSDTIDYGTSPGQLSGTLPGGGDGTYTYQWQSSTDNSTWNNISGATSQNYTPGNLTTLTYFRRVTTSNGVSVNSTNTVVVSIIFPQFKPGSISPTSLSINYNSSPGQITGTLPSGGNGTYAYQWQSWTGNNPSVNISGATGQNYTPGNLTSTTNFVRVASSDGMSVFSNLSVINVYPQLVAGTLSPAIQQLNYGGTPTVITSTEPVGGNGSYTYQWQSSSDSVTWTNITGAIANSYTPPSATVNYDYRLEVNSNGALAYSLPSLVSVPMSGGTISTNTATVNSGGGITLVSATPADGGGSVTYTYQYQSSNDDQNWTNISSTTVTNLTQTTWFRREATASDGATAYSNTVRVKVEPATPMTITPTTATAPAAGTAASISMPAYPGGLIPDSMNYIQSRTFVAPGMTTLSTANSQTANTVVHQSTTYYDGLGRPIQTVNMQSTPENHDLISTIFYDDFGRVAQQYLPYEDGGAGGQFRSNANTTQPAFYNSQFSNSEGYYYSNTQYEASPLNRVLKQTAPGDSWTGHNVGVSYLERTNDLYDSVKIWTIDTTEDALPVTSGNYAPGTLYVTETTDENGNEIVQYKDLEGQVVLKKTEIADAVNPGHSGWLCTYYVYGDRGNLRFVIPPDAVNWLEANNWTLNQTIRYNLCFSYLYDGRNRMIMKQVPGGGKTYMVYDLRDRLVFSQDSVERKEGDWLTTFYDGLNRPVMTALYPTTDDRATLQAMMDNTTSYTTQQVIYTSNSPAPANIVTNSRQWDNAPAQYTATNSITFLPGFSTAAGDNFTASINPSAQVTTTDTLYEVSADNPVPNITGYEPLTYTYYDNYSWGGAKNFDNSEVADLNAGSNLYADAVTPTASTRGLVTGKKIKILNPTNGTEQWLTTTTYYDDKDRVIQTLSDNITGSTDELTTQYDFSGKVLSTYLDHQNARSTTTPEVKVLTMNGYDAGGRLLSVTKEINNDPTTERTIATYAYNELGQMAKKTLSPSFGGGTGGGLDTLHYDYNIRGWLNGINMPYVNSTSSLTPGPGHYFGTELDYDYGFNQPQVNGNIAGEEWKSASDGYERAYGFNYDNANRILKADFTQNNSGTWDNTLGSGNIDFSVKNLAYDANGNIESMRQMGLKVNNSAPIDELAYKYNSNSNQLFSVTDTASDPNTTLGDFHDGTNPAGSADYSYDGNGNLTEDQNKGITNIHYNYLNLPDSVSFGTTKGNIKFVYDAAGDKLQKIVTDNTTSPAKITTTDYIDGFEYNNDTLQFFPTEEGRVRYIPADSTIPAAYVYDYFIKDHLGNIRMVLTEQTKEDLYAATMEPQNATVENQLFDNVSSTAVPKPTIPPGFDSDPNNTKVSQLDGSNGNNTLPRVGPSIVLKVMAGDTVTIGTYAWYTGAVQPPPTPSNNLLNDLLNALTGGIITNSHGIYNTTDNNPNTVLSGDLDNFFSTDENTNYTSAAPKAFLNWVAFDNQLNEVSANSGVVQVPTITGSEQAQPLVAPEQIIQKDGYIYIYVSNESAQKVYFDNLVIHHNRGPILQTDNYYPFGLTMAGISDQAALSLENKFKFQSQELNHKEFSDGSGLDTYQFKFRMDDPQIGRFWQVDPLANKYVYNSPYAFSEDKVTGDVELEGLESIPINPIGELWRSAGITTGTNAKQYAKDLVKGMVKPSNVAKGTLMTGEIAVPIIVTGLMTDGIGDMTVSEGEAGALDANSFSAETNLADRAKEIHSALSPATQSRNTTAVASATTSEGNNVILVGSNENKLRTPQIQALKPGEIPVEGEGHAEITILNHASANGMKVNAVAASRPICANCATAINNAGAQAASPLKIYNNPPADATYVKPQIPSDWLEK